MGMAPLGNDVEAMLARSPFDSRFVHAGSGFAEFAECGLVACIPARDEESRVAASIAALDRELRNGDGLVLLMNGCRDDTAGNALRALAGWRRPVLLIDGDFEPGTGSAPRARRLAMDLAHALAPQAVLLSTDADTLVQPGLRSAYEGHLAEGFDLICGAIGFIEAEAACLPPSDPDADRVVREYRASSREIAERILPDADNPWPHHGNIGGAKFAITSRAYERIGGLPTPVSGEDRALRRLCAAMEMRIRYSDGPQVLTSCRLDGRAPGGLSDELKRSREEVDPLVDELLEPPAALLTRLQAQKAFLSAAGRSERLRLLAFLDVPGEGIGRLAEAGDGLAWMQVEELSPRLARRRLRHSDLVRHLPDLLRIRDRMREDPADRRDDPAA